MANGQQPLSASRASICITSAWHRKTAQSPPLPRFLTVSLIVVSLATGLNYMFSNTDSSGYSGYNSSGGYYGGGFSGGHK